MIQTYSDGIPNEAGRELDGMVAERVYRYRRTIIGKDARGQHGGTEVLVPPSWNENDVANTLPKLGPVALWHFAPDASTNIETARGMEDRIVRRGLLAPYLDALADLVHARTEDRVANTWRMMRASAADRCRAALLSLAQKASADR